MNSTEYTPIDCHFYDELEAASVKKIDSTLLYLNEDEEEKVCKGLIINFIHINKAEYLVLNDGFKLRLDKIISLNNKIAPKTNCIINE